VLVWRQYPTEIEAELADRGHDIMDWHAGRMSSRRLLVLLKHPRTDGPYETALRDGGFTTLEKMIAELHKEFALYRASHYVDTDNEYTPKVFLDQREAKKLLADQEAEEREQERSEEDLYAGLGWT
jgi:hypothetical protein